MTEAGGWTLLELMVVVTIAAILGGRAVLSLGGGQARSLGAEAERLASLLDAARDGSVLESRHIVVIFSKEGYRFRDAEGQPLAGDDAGDVFRDRAFPPGISLTDAQSSEAKSGEETRLRYTPWGDAPHFELELFDGSHRIKILGKGSQAYVEAAGA